MENEKKPNKVALIILIIAFLVGGFCLGIVFDKEVLSNNKCETAAKKKSEEPKKPEEQEKTEEPKKPEESERPEEPEKPDDNLLEQGERLSKKDTLIKIYKEEAKKRGLYKEESIEKITFNATYKGYLTGEPNIHYYVVYGTFKCKGSDISCVYQEQLDDPLADGSYEWSVGLKIDETNGRFDYKEMGSFWMTTPTNAVIVNEELK